MVNETEGIGYLEKGAVFKHLRSKGMLVKDIEKKMGVSRVSLNKYERHCIEHQAEAEALMASPRFPEVVKAVLAQPQAKAAEDAERKARDREMVKDIRSDMPRDEITAKYGVSIKRVYQVMNKLGLHGRQTGMAREGAVDEACKLYHEKRMTPAGIAVELGVTVETLFKGLDAAGVELPLPARAAKLVHAGYDLDEIAHRLGWGKNRLRRQLGDEYGIRLSRSGSHPLDARILAMMMAGAPKRQIYALLGVNFRNVDSVVDRTGYPERVEEIRKAVEDGKSVEEIAIGMGVHRTLVEAVVEFLEGEQQAENPSAGGPK